MTNLLKLSTLSLLLLAGYSGRAQVLLSENFEGGIPNSWTLINGDGHTVDSNVAWITNAWVAWVDSSDLNNHVAESTSWYNPAGTADDWLITPPINLTANNFLRWRAIARDPNNRDGYEVRISTTPGNSPQETDFTSLPALFTISHEAALWTTRQVELNAYAGQTVRLAFRNNSHDLYLLDIDDVLVGTHPLHDMAMDSVARPEYAQIPLRLVQPLTFGARVVNNGVDTCMGVMVKVTLSYGGNALVNDSSATVTVADSASEFVSIPDTFMPTVSGVYIIQYIVSTTSVDQISANDTITDYFLVTDSIYARDQGTYSGSFGAGNSISAYLGQMFELTDTIALTSVSMLLLQPTPGDLVSAVVFSFDSVPDSIVAVTPVYTFPDASQRFLTLPIQGGSKVLLPGKYVVAAREYYHRLTLAFTPDIYTPGATWDKFPLDSTGTWTHNENYQRQVSYLLRPNFGVCTLAPDSIITTLPTCSNSSNGSVKVFVSGGYLSIAYNWSQGSTIDSIGGLATQTPYVVIATDGFGCTFKDSIILDAQTHITDSLGAMATTDTTGSTFVVTLAGGKLPYTYLWNNNETTDTLSNLRPGEYYLTITDSNGCSIHDSVLVPLHLGINNTNGFMALNIYPNPVNNVVNLSITLPSAENISLQLFNTMGQLVFARKGIYADQLNTSIDMVSMPPGFYMLNVRTAKVIRTEKLMKY